MINVLIPEQAQLIQFTVSESARHYKSRKFKLRSQTIFAKSDPTRSTSKSQFKHQEVMSPLTRISLEMLRKKLESLTFQRIEHLIYAEVETVKGGMPRAPTLQTKGNGYHALLSLRSRLQTSLEVVSPLGPHLSIHVSLEIAKRVN